MGLMKHKNEIIYIHGDKDKIFKRIIDTGNKIGKVQEVDNKEYFMVVDFSIKFSIKKLRNPVTVKISLEGDKDQQKEHKNT